MDPNLVSEWNDAVGNFCFICVWNADYHIYCPLYITYLLFVKKTTDMYGLASVLSFYDGVFVVIVQRVISDVAPVLSLCSLCHYFGPLCSHCPPVVGFIRWVKKEEFEDTKRAIRSRISKKNRQHNGQKEKYKRTNNDQQNIHIKLKIE
jgi:hypothetical protein